MSIALALERARELARRPWTRVSADGGVRTRRFAIGDPQAPIERFFAVLEHNGLLAADGMLAGDVFLVSIGDHFDWGGPEVRERAAQSGLALLAWLAAHPPDQVVLIAGNHDLGRVGELSEFDDARFAVANAEAVRAYRGGDPDPALEATFLARYPALPTVEVAARDFAAFSEAQRDLVAALLKAGRWQLAHADSDKVLLCHAGVTVDYLEPLGVDKRDAHAIAAALNRRLASAFEAWKGGPLVIPGLHQPGSSAVGEGVGMLYHRPANPAAPANAGYELTGVMNRRFDPRRLPRGITQVVGHISDSKCRQVLGDWAGEPAAAPGAVRHLITDGALVAYGRGARSTRHVVDPAHMVFIDGSMSRTPPDAYELLELDALSGRSCSDSS